ncbi:metal ABC transporter solute-binding protein, Zn/Mn family [Bacillus solimangrovi]|uniref:Manganese transporter n=1 Tax=Bacillus solimangrovi TaxID=1305675 RepID=A0A1E5LF67_9BACI|nr:zinc ABC transporter substrate-binding protein [Bacillus solimangrovi]OEH92712.1 manganese transporter [Bacillus solimangrovi]
MKRMIMSLSLIFSMFILGACSQSEVVNQSDEGKLMITTTTAQVGDLVKNVGGDYVEVTSLMGPGTDPHLYQATQNDIKKLNQAEIIFYNGLHLEGKMNEIFEKMESQKPTYAVAHAIPEDKLIKQGKDAFDPHIWFDINLWKYAVDEVANGLGEYDKAHKEEYLANAEKYKAELDALEAFANERLSEIPEKSRVLVTAHDAFSYFGNAFEMEVEGLQGLSTDSEFGLKDVQNIVDVLVEREIKAVFIESSISENSIQAVVEGARERGHDVVIGGELYSDAMGEEGTEEGTYVGMYKHNINTITTNLK